MYKKISEEENRRMIEDIKASVKIVDIASELGYKLVRVGSYFKLAKDARINGDGSSIRIDPRRNIYFRNSQDNRPKSVIDFLIEFNGLRDFHEAMNWITSKNRYIYISNNTQPRVTKPEKKEFKLPDRDNNIKNVYAYLIKSRGIDKDIVDEMLQKGYLRQDKRKNCMFIGYTDKTLSTPCFATLRGTNTNSTFKGDVAGSDYTKGFYIDNDSPVLYVTESPIDALSLMMIIKHCGGDYSQNNYLSLGSVNKYGTVYEILEREKKIDEVVLCLDSDKAGIEATQKLCEGLKNKKVVVRCILPQKKDINEDLCSNKKCFDYYKDYLIPQEELER